ncbi:acetyltransferase [Marinoscillum furvescens]|uniref:Sugar O-acyltransferase (Sialic acid O-acetyltransferase NeuD family) n=1 Tax=Marinoscillum furvescens DSM 4134 TaxID=1122208 RepID=A0A3D9LIB7_MARFU|nr:acetyltransferase [Marinoscillum furvescens]REE05769.1 sugar O-acyltransferase (sialic acid O-acetyltransferase NeuD family) [Marinoscillum furvescens DSM 4134]
MDKPVIIFGAKGIGTAALEIFKSNNVVVYGFLEDSKDLHGKEIDDVPVLGDTEDHGFLKLIGQKTEAFVATDDNALRKKQVKKLMDSRKVMPTNAVHQAAIISDSAAIGHGNFINARVTLGPDTTIGQHCLIHTGAIIEHNTTVGDFVQIGAGATINSGVTIANEAFIGSGALIVSGVKIGKKARIGAGSVVVADVEDGATVFGNPATPIQPK